MPVLLRELGRKLFVTDLVASIEPKQVFQFGTLIHGEELEWPAEDQM
jgi:hypothetical protein